MSKETQLPPNPPHEKPYHISDTEPESDFAFLTQERLKKWEKLKIEFKKLLQTLSAEESYLQNNNYIYRDNGFVFFIKLNSETMSIDLYHKKDKSTGQIESLLETYQTTKEIIDRINQIKKT